jgi:hypothetical protein
VAVCSEVTVAEVEPSLVVPSDKSVPVPLSETFCGMSDALSAIDRVAVRRLPVPVGVNSTLTEQLAPGASEDPQLGVSEKSLRLPLTLMLVETHCALPLFVSVVVCAALVVPTI